MSDTPRTDAREWDWHEDCSLVDDMIVDADFARQLERELFDVRKLRDTLAEALLPLLAMTVAMLKNDTKTLHSEITITDKKTGNQTSMKVIEVIENADAAYRRLERRCQ